MAKKRVYELAKELGIAAKELLTRLQKAGLEKSGNFSTLEDDEIVAIHKLFNPKAAKGAAAKAEPAPVRPAPATQQAPKVQGQQPKAEVKAKPQPPQQKPPQAAPKVEAKPRIEPKPQPDRKFQPQAAAPQVATKPAEPVAQKAAPKPVEPPARPVRKVPRPPVVTILGHVDHGKTTLLDYIRKSHITEGEAGGITQSIGAYQVEFQGKKITFIDTPGHAAFSNMRSRGAKATDIVVLVIAADDGVMAQTEEALSHARAAKVPIIVAVNKIDKAPDRLDRVKQELAKRELTPEDWGGSTIVVPMSALKGTGVDTLLEMILLTAEIQEIAADPDGPVDAVVIESYMDTQKGPITSILVKSGTLRSRDVVVADTSYGRIRALVDDRGRRMEEVPPGTPAQLLGLDKAPAAGAKLEVFEDGNAAKALAEARLSETRKVRLNRQRPSMADIMNQMLQKGKLRLVLKADSMGSLEVMEAELRKIKLEDVSIEILHTGVGPVSESDVVLAASGEDVQAAVIGFRTHVDKNASDIAQQLGVTLRTYSIIYDLTQEVERALKRLLKPEYQEVKLGEIEVRNVFRIPRVGTVAGCFVRDGMVVRSGQIRVFRDGVEIHHGPIRTLRRFDEDARQVEKGKECGILLEGFDNVQEGDRLESFKVERVEV